ncbi:MAG TPA: hypothetical protein V6C89_02725 [Drouetiella sp.]|jgi:hypothetical protein
MSKKTPGQKRNERPNEVEEERTDKGGLKSDTKPQGLKPHSAKVPEAEPEDDEDEYETEDDDDESDDDDE